MKFSSSPAFAASLASSSVATSRSRSRSFSPSSSRGFGGAVRAELELRARPRSHRPSPHPPSSSPSTATRPARAVTNSPRRPRRSHPSRASRLDVIVPIARRESNLGVIVRRPLDALSRESTPSRPPSRAEGDQERARDESAHAASRRARRTTLAAASSDERAHIESRADSFDRTRARRHGRGARRRATRTRAVNDGRARWTDAGRAGARARRRGADRRWTVVDGQREGVARDGPREARARPDVDDARRGVARGSGAVRARAVDDGRVDAHGRISSRLVSTAGTSERARERSD